MEEKSNEEENAIGGQTPNPGYGIGQIAKAMTTAEEHPDPETRERAQRRIEKWMTVFQGMMDATLRVGTRTPVQGVPEWATLEVISGGFATGSLLAGGALLEHERATLDRISTKPESDARLTLNHYYLSGEGLRSLLGMLESGCYTVTVPEEGALLVVAWLVENDRVREAGELLAILVPWFPKLRFYPVPGDRPRKFDSLVFLQDVRSTLEALKSISPKRRALALRESVDIWAPMYDRMVELFLETVEGEPPSLQRGPDGALRNLPGGAFLLRGGWPCAIYPEGWRRRAAKLLDDYQEQRAAHMFSGRPDRKQRSFFQLREFLRRCADDPSSLSGRDVGRIRLILAGSITKRGIPGTPRHRAARELQMKEAGAPLKQELAQIIVQRLDGYPLEDGVDDIDPLTSPITPREAEGFRGEAGMAIPGSLQRVVARSLRASPEALIGRGVITSGEVLARVLPQMTSGIRAAAVSDPTLRDLAAAIYRAFSRRRSLLLLNLEKQIRIGELPWVAAIDSLKASTASDRDAARSTLKDVALLNITSFPQTIVPNKLLQELVALAQAAKLDLPLVKEVAADIFAGEFTSVFLESAKRAAALLDGTLYAKYYGIDYQGILKMTDVPKTTKSSWFRKATVISGRSPFVELCEARAGVSYMRRYAPERTAMNGMIIEQQQILTTQNLAALFGEFGLAGELGDGLIYLCMRCFGFVCQELRMRKGDGWHDMLIRIKNAAYAWRQMIFFISLLPSAEVERFIRWMGGEYLAARPEEFQARFRPAIKGLELASRGRSIDTYRGDSDAHRFLGWSSARHWLMGEKPDV